MDGNGEQKTGEDNGKKSLAAKIKENVNVNIEVNWGAFHLSANATSLIGGSLFVTLAAFLLELLITVLKKLFT